MIHNISPLGWVVIAGLGLVVLAAAFLVAGMAAAVKMKNKHDDIARKDRGRDA